MTDLPQNIAEFKKKYGNRGVPIAVREFIARAPEFKGDADLARLLGEMMGDLQNVLGNEAEPTSGKDCASNVLSFAINLETARRHMLGDGDSRDTVRIVAQILDTASSSIASAVTTCELGPGGSKRSVEALTLAELAKELADVARNAKSEIDFVDKIGNKVWHLERGLNRLIGDLTENDFRA